MIFLPTYPLQRCLEVLINNLNDNEEMTLKQVFSLDLEYGQLIPLLFVVVHGIIACFLPFVLDYVLRNKGRKAVANEKEILGLVPRSSDENVIKEKFTCSQPDPSAVILDNLVKVFVTKGKEKRQIKAVNGLSFKIEKGQVFCLLGVNGSGKTTSMSVITGELTASAGNVSVFGMDVRNDVDGIRRRLGVAPQKNTHFDLLTVKEHFDLFAAIVGIPVEFHGPTVDGVVSRFGFNEYLARKADALSGGYKRRLQLAIACLGQPDLLLLDEPSSAMSPEARRTLWSLIEAEKRRGCAILLTTHSMGEAEKVSDRIAIMGRGSLKCIGSGQRLKSLYGTGNKVILSLNEGVSREKVLEFAKTLSQDAKISSFIAGKIAQVDYALSVPVSQIFKFLESSVSAGLFNDYAVTETTLEHVFIRFARASQEEENREREQLSREI
ncbi:hypothetical protein GEMRC1_007737 [Eukaryota sp. GEM-RC1]